ncbi:hypothetical protein EGR_10941 [Echinococcus granulosus]|uniref:Uncharacterized protein n=1 Tax=Echinococcus granulosus TaxID=6210 RepID=W6U754_ECHGR|nr:hypothetical protein EGR_10941 [Echinococcus granulosus]EUB54197.1 hypothetical protein EGR_10941 [Echinococcus granulosus]
MSELRMSPFASTCIPCAPICDQRFTPMLSSRLLEVDSILFRDAVRANSHMSICRCQLFTGSVKRQELHSTSMLAINHLSFSVSVLSSASASLIALIRIYNCD